ncbi:type II toxin-antitoxin system ParD family antitoxin [Thalassotalea sp. PS06]|uniref:ribbon-helix-helix domain-containing protein n=1 Tax=Thalassotalea sp. PS06 TaxID=2594005 RepID=UPI0011647569|nr:CopG family transcriptional regulator [Thalassotalea sp. PS06]QDP01967.1 CopG family transcriptional regulator [Thalassotalea sp. PS06]
MARQSITLTEPNDEWLKSQVSAHHEYSNKSELINDLIRQARRADMINQKLALSEASGSVEQSKEDILKEFKAKLK